MRRQDNMPKRHNKHFRPTAKGAGMTRNGAAAERRKNPGPTQNTAGTGTVKPGTKPTTKQRDDATRNAGQMKKFPKAAKDPNSRLRQARRRWKC